MTDAWTPHCMSPEEFELWSAANASITATGSRVGRPCADCPVAYAADMRLIGRCNGTPGHEADGMDETPVALSLPCGGCAHVAVCRIRPTLDGLAQARIAMTEVDAAVTVRVSAEVECSHFRKAPKSAGAPAGSNGTASHWTPERRAAQSRRIKEINARKKAEAADAS